MHMCVNRCIIMYSMHNRALVIRKNSRSNKGIAGARPDVNFVGYCMTFSLQDTELVYCIYYASSALTYYNYVHMCAYVYMLKAIILLCLCEHASVHRARER